jgi:hypothetical protein
MSTRNLLSDRTVFGTLKQLRHQTDNAIHDFGIGNKELRTVMNNSLKLVILLLTSAIGLSSCKDQIADPNANPVVFPASNVSFAQHVQPLFQSRCAFAGCHAGSNPAGGLDLSSPAYNSLMSHQPRLVVTGESTNSLLIERLDGRIPPQMPFNAQPINANQLAGMKKWIDEAAQNN